MRTSLIDLRKDLLKLLETEESQTPDWDSAAEVCTYWINKLNQTKCVNLIDDFTYHYLEDFEIRQYDQKYARQQHKRLKIVLET